MKTEIKEISNLPLTLTVEDVARILGISRVGAYNLFNCETFPAHRIGRRYIVFREAFFRWFNKDNGNNGIVM